MITLISKFIADSFYRKEIIAKDEIEKFCYGLEAIIGITVNLIVVLISGIINKMIFSSMIFFIVFNMLRIYTGGYHADNHTNCNIMMLVNSSLVLIIVRCLAISNLVNVAILLFISIFTYVLSPVSNKNKKIDSSKVKFYKRSSFLITLLSSLSSILLYPLKKNISLTITLTLLSVVIAMIAGKMKEGEIHEDDLKRYC